MSCSAQAIVLNHSSYHSTNVGLNHEMGREGVSVQNGTFICHGNISIKHILLEIVFTFAGYQC